MARLVTTGLEENNFTATIWNSAGAGMSIVTTPVHSGTFSMRSLTTGTPNASGRLILAGNKTSGSLFAATYFRIATVPSATDQLYLHMSSGGVRSLEANLLNVGGNGRIQLKNVITGTIDDSTFDLSLNTWYRIETELLISNSVGTMELRAFEGDSTTQLFTALSITGEDTLPGNIRYLVVGQNSQNSGDIYFDDIRLNDEVGTFENSFPGPGKIFLLEPDGDDVVTWDPTPASPATNFDKVDDLPGAPDDLTTYNSTSTANEVDKFTLTNLGAEVPSDADMILADVYSRHGSDGTAGQRDIKHRIWDEADTSTDGPVCSASINGWRICDTDEHLVFDLGTRSKANVDAFKVGYLEGNGNTRLKRVTAQWVNVEWIEAAVAAVIPELNVAPYRPT